MKRIQEVVQDTVMIGNECNIRIPNICMLAMRNEDNKYLFEGREEKEIYGIIVLHKIKYTGKEKVKFEGIASKYTNYLYGIRKKMIVKRLIVYRNSRI